MFSPTLYSKLTYMMLKPRNRIPFCLSFMGRKYVEPPPMNLRECYNDSSVLMPLIFILSTGSDPNKDMQAGPYIIGVEGGNCCLL